MDIGFSGDIIAILRESIDEDEPVRMYAKLLQTSDVGITIHYGEGEDETTYFIPFSNIRAIEKAPPESENEVQQWTQ